MKLNKIIEFCEFFYPPSASESYDNIGLQLGDQNSEINCVMTALQITDSVIDEAIEKKSDLIIVHHPLIFKEIKTLATDVAHNKLIIRLIKNNIAVYAMHTNVDSAFNGINDWIMQVLNIKRTQVLDPKFPVNLKRIEIEVNQYEIEDFLGIMRKIGAGQNSKNISEFYLLPKIKNTVETTTLSEHEDDVVIIEAELTDEQIGQLKKEIKRINIQSSKNYRFKIIPLENAKYTTGFGRIGYLQPTTLEELATNFKELFDLSSVKIVGNYETIIKKIAIVAGSGADYIELAKQKKCDVLITGDVSFHRAHDAIEQGIAIIDVGHIIELIFNDVMGEFIQLLDEKLTVLPSEINIDPFEVI